MKKIYTILLVGVLFTVAAMAAEKITTKRKLASNREPKLIQCVSAISRSVTYFIAKPENSPTQIRIIPLNEEVADILLNANSSKKEICLYGTAIYDFGSAVPGADMEVAFVYRVNQI